jgi:hypothetical protein
MSTRMPYIYGPNKLKLKLRGKGSRKATIAWVEFLEEIEDELENIEFSTEERLYQETRPSRATGMVQTSDNTYYPGNDFTYRRFQSFWK